MPSRWPAALALHAHTALLLALAGTTDFFFVEHFRLEKSRGGLRAQGRKAESERGKSEEEGFVGAMATEFATTKEACDEAQVPQVWRDACAHLLIPLNACRKKEFYLPWKYVNTNTTLMLSAAQGAHLLNAFYANKNKWSWRCVDLFRMLCL